jgi:hypothetical protein
MQKPMKQEVAFVPVEKPVRFEPLGTSQFCAGSCPLSTGKLVPVVFRSSFGWIKTVLENHINFPCTYRMEGWLGIIQSQVIFGGFREFP